MAPKHQPETFKFARTDAWREGEWVDLWSVVHILSGFSIGLGFFFLRFGAFASVALALLSLISYEMWETIVHIEETPANRFMDVVAGMAGFAPAFFLLPRFLAGAAPQAGRASAREVPRPLGGRATVAAGSGV